MNDKEEYAPQNIKNWILQDDIDRLLHDDIDDMEDHKPIDPYSLDSTVSFNLESHSKKGELPPAYKNLKPASKSVLECEIMKEVNGHLHLSGIYAAKGKNIIVRIPGMLGRYLVPVNCIKILLQEYAKVVTFKPCLNGTTVFVKVEVDRQVLLDGIVGRVA